MSNNNKSVFFAVDIKPFVIVGHTTVREPKNGMRFLKDPTVIGISIDLTFLSSLVGDVTSQC